MIKHRKTKPVSWYLDLSLLANYWGGERVYHHTAPVADILGLREGLRVILEEGLENRYERHRRNAAALRAGLEAMNIEFVVEAAHRLDQITVVWIPEGIDDAAVRRRLLADYSIEIGAGLGQFRGKVWRFGLMGESSRSEHIIAVLRALETILPEMGYEVPHGAAVKAASDALALA
jgi:alanine-glyoxylate transaminase/serine-glyoxylate transaminase/serine-pyruvate transaminase